jgi:pyruvate dehydrogenase E2 component (dihydrolipoamide acetyltransferase)
LETAKAEVEIPSPYAGRVVELGGAVGDVLPVGSLLVRVDTGADADTASEPNGDGHVRNPVLVGYGTDADFDASRRTAPPAGPDQEDPPARDPRPKAKPAVRKLAAELLVDLGTLEPGPDGLISREAVLAAAGVHGEQRPGVSHDVLPVRGVHAAMAKRMALSRSQIPDAHASIEVDGTRLLELRDRLGLSPFTLTLRLLVLALTHHRILNSTWVDGPDGPQVHTHHAVHLGVAMAAPRGLLVPVVRNAEAMTTRELASAVDRLIGAGRDGVLTPAELQGSTFTVSNFGALALDQAVPVINYPESAILGVGSLRPRPVVVDGALAVRSTMVLTCAFDHRVADGAQVAAFMGELRGLIGAPETALLDL